LTAENINVATVEACAWLCETNRDAIQINMTINSNWPQQNKEEAVTYGDYFSTINIRTRIPKMFSWISGNDCSTSKSVFIYSTISRGAPDDVTLVAKQA